MSSLVWKIERADKHIQDIGDELAAFQEAKTKAIVREDDPRDRERVLWLISDASFPPRIPLLLGDAVHNLRSALDHLVAIKSREHSGTNTVWSKTEFPIWRESRPFNPKQFVNDVCKRKVGQTSPRVFAEFAALEPHEGGAHRLLWVLDQLDVIDKHRFLIVVATGLGRWRLNLGPSARRFAERIEMDVAIPDMWYSGGPTDRKPLVDRGVIFGAPKSALMHESDDEVQFTFDITLGEPAVFEGEAILPTLAQLRQVTVDTIAFFLPLP